ncbi:MAG: Na(+)-translocating NADH-quinone reductase subunit A [Thermoanaerobaculales bacterium]
MATNVIKKGLDLPISGGPVQRIEPGATVSRIAILARDYPFMKPRMHVQAGEAVKRGQVLFEDRKTEGVRYTSPGAGTVVAIHRGERRALRSVVVELTPPEAKGQPADADHQEFSSFSGRDVRDLDGPAVRDLLVESGLWTAIRRRPFSIVPAPTEACHSIFVTAIDTNPNGADPSVVLEGKQEDLQRGLWALSMLTEGPVFVCRTENAPISDLGDAPRLQVEEFRGPHPAGLAGTHIHLLDPVDREKSVWYVGCQDVVAIGRLVTTGKLDVERVVALGGPVVKNPRLLATRLGASIDALVDRELTEGEVRVISGSVLYGHRAMGEVEGYLGRYATQISCLAEDSRREFLGWMRLGFGSYSTVRAFASSFGFSRRFDLTTSAHGGHRAMVPIGMFERVMPLDIMPTFLLRALLSGDLERAEALGCLELDEEDLALCSFVSPGKEDYAPALRRNLLEIWKEG